MDHRAFTLLSLLALLLNPFTVLQAQWSGNPAVNNALCTAANNQEEPAITGDGAGGAIVTWMDLRNGTNYDIYAQRINSSGTVQWTADGVAISTAANQQFPPAITGDGAGGAIIVWYEYISGLNYDIYAQRVDASGAVQWTTNGVPIAAAADIQDSPVIVADGSGGAIIAWRDRRNGSHYDIYAQRINGAGAVQWTADGVPVVTAASVQEYPAIISDDAGGAIITWQDFRTSEYDIYAQRIDGTGVVQWTADGVLISNADHNQERPVITRDGSGGAIIAWQDYRSSFSDIYAQSIDAAGSVQWTANGVAVSAAVEQQNLPSIAGDGAGNAVIAWMDRRNDPPYYDIYAQSIDKSGAARWTADGIAVSSAAYSQSRQIVISDGADGTLLAWYDPRNGTNSDIYAQRLNVEGTAQWVDKGLAMATAASFQDRPVMVGDGSGGAIIAWMDKRGGTYYDIYASKLHTDGTLPMTLSSFTARRDPSGAGVQLEWTTASETDGHGFDIQRRPASAPLSEADREEGWRTIGFVPASGTTAVPHAYVFADRTGPAGRLAYRLRQIERSGRIEHSSTVIVETGGPAGFSLGQNYPNPFNPATTIVFTVPSPTFVTLKVFDILGNEVAVLASETVPAGTHVRRWNAATAASGVYHCRLQAGGFSESKRLLLIR